MNINTKYKINDIVLYEAPTFNPNEPSMELNEGIITSIRTYTSDKLGTKIVYTVKCNNSTTELYESQLKTIRHHYNE